jgi:dihydrolipoamide dehydrogenase
MSENKKVVVLGAGPGGYTAAFAAADLGLEVCLIDKQSNPGGVCLYKGCIPSKALLHAAKLITEANKSAQWGIDFGQPKIDLSRLRSWKEGIVKKLTDGLGFLTKQRGIEYIQGTGSFLDSHTLKITGKFGEKEIRFDYCILATGSVGIDLFNARVAGKVVNSTGALSLAKIPQRMLVIGGGYIGLELGTVYAALGSKVSLVEMMPAILPTVDKDVVSILQRRLEKSFESVMLNTKITRVNQTDDKVEVELEGGFGTKKDQFDQVLVAVGRRPNTAGLGLENTKVRLDERGFVLVDEQKRSSDPSIFAIGDITAGPMLAHKASHEGKVAAMVISGQKATFSPEVIPSVIYTDPEIAVCGLTENEAKAQGRKVLVSRFPWAASGRAVSMDSPEGLTKIIADAESERILGMEIVGSGAGDLISEGVVAIEMGARASDLESCIHPHPTLSETIMEAAEGIYNRSTHIYKRRR